MDLKDIRTKIDKADKELFKLLDERMALSSEVAESKLISGAPVLSSERESSILAAAEGTNFPEENVSVMRAVLSASRSLQYKLLAEKDPAWELGKKIEAGRKYKAVYNRVAYGGKQGSYAAAAAAELFPGAEIIGYRNFSDSCVAVSMGKADAAVLPLENTTAGTVNEVYDLIPAHKLYIVKSLSHMIQHKLLTLKGADINAVKTVVSHPQALSQCSAFIKARGLNTVECENTAYAAEEVRSKNEPSFAAIGSIKAAEDNGLEAQNIEINDAVCNQTRFVAVSGRPEINESADKVSIAFRLPHKSGSLAMVLYMFMSLNINLTKIQSRPIADRPWEYIFYADFQYLRRDDAMRSLYQLDKELPELIFLGWY